MVFVELFFVDEWKYFYCNCNCNCISVDFMQEKRDLWRKRLI